MSNSTLAPSEKHLEDWIVANTRFVGDAMEVEEGDAFWADACPHLPDGRVIGTGFEKIIARQLNLPSGICDLIALVDGMYLGHSLAVVELKKGIIDTLAFTQCLRYMRDLNEVFYHAVMDRRLWDGYQPVSRFDMSHGTAPEIAGVLIGHSIQSNSLLIACQAAGIQVFTYEYHDGIYIFESHSADTVGRIWEIHREFAAGALGDAIEEIVNRNRERRVAR